MKRLYRRLLVLFWLWTSGLGSEGVMRDRTAKIPCYVGRDKCGCIVNAIVDAPDGLGRDWMAKEIKEFMCECINEGLTVDRTDVGTVRKSFGHHCGRELQRDLFASTQEQSQTLLNDLRESLELLENVDSPDRPQPKLRQRS